LLRQVGYLRTLRSWITSFVLFVLMASATPFQESLSMSQPLGFA